MRVRSATEQAELRRLVMRLERELTGRSQLRTLLAASDTAVALYRLDLRMHKIQIAGRSLRAKRLK
jgi:hypothetical protein